MDELYYSLSASQQTLGFHQDGSHFSNKSCIEKAKQGFVLPLTMQVS